MKLSGRSVARAVFAGAIFAAASSFAAAQQVFPTPEAAANALVEAAKDPGKGQIDTIFGPEGRDLLLTGDPDLDKQRLSDFLGLAAIGQKVVDAKDGDKALEFGVSGWQFPIPLQPVSGGWRFDIAAGKQAITDRTVGSNEYVAISACADFVAAETEYFASLHDDEPVQQYAKKFLSSPGRHDGLFWEPADQSDRSPLGSRIELEKDIKAGKSGAPDGYHGYIYRILTGQGAAAPGGAYSYLVKGRLLAGFAMLAYPVTWGETGVMTFLCDQRGTVYEANLGAGTAKQAAAITSFDPVAGWERVSE